MNKIKLYGKNKTKNGHRKKKRIKKKNVRVTKNLVFRKSCLVSESIGG